MVKVMDFPASVLFFRVNEMRNERRFYRLRLTSTLFGEHQLLREFGRIGQAGRVMYEGFETQEAAEVALCRLARQKLQRGYRRIYKGSPHATANPVKFRPGAADFDFIHDPMSGALLMMGAQVAVHEIRSLLEDQISAR